MGKNRKSKSQNNRKPVSSRAQNRRLAQRASKSQLHDFEVLEDRRLLAAVTVGNNTDVVDGDVSSITNLIASPGADGISLREAIAASNVTDGPDTITFDPAVFTGGASSLIRLTQGGLGIWDSMNIDASAAVDVTITGDALGNDVVDASFITDIAESGPLSVFSSSNLLDDNSRVFAFGREGFSSSGDLTLTGLTITGGFYRGFGSYGGGGGIYFFSNDRLTLTDTIVSGNGSGREGGGIHAQFGEVILENSEVSRNASSADSNGFDSGGGGGIFVDNGSLALTDTVVSGNYTARSGARGGGIFTSSSPVTLTNSEITDNHTRGGSSRGGGIYTSRGSLTLVGTTVSGNSTLGGSSGGGGIGAVYADAVLTDSVVGDNQTLGFESPGGGIYAGSYFYNSSGSVTLTNSTISGNSTIGDGGRGGGIATTRPLTVEGSTIVNNSTAGETAFEFSIGDSSSSGGGISALAPVTLTNTTVQGNSTSGDDAVGGGIAGFEVTLTNSMVLDNSTAGERASGGGIDGATLTLTESTVRGNSTSGVEATGGGISAGSLNATNSTFDANSTDGDDAFGGGISLSDGVLMGSTVSGNSASGANADGGGISFRFDGFGSVALSLLNSTVSGNSTNGTGGAISLGQSQFNRSFELDLNLISTTITNNSSAGDGGGVFVFDFSRFPTTTIENSILAGNIQNLAVGSLGVPNDLVVSNPNRELTISYSLIGVADSITQPITNNFGNRFGTAASPLDPRLAPLADNGGPTQTHALLPNSPAFDAGSLALAVDENGDPLPTDQRGVGFDRVSVASVDIGSFELDISGFPDGPVVLNTVRDEGGVLDRPDLLTTYAVTFDTDVDVEAEDLLVFNDSLNRTAVDLSAVAFTYDSTTLTATWDFSALPLDPAFYFFELSDNIVLADSNVPLDGDGDGIFGGNFVESLYVAIPGDANLDGRVTVLGDAFPLIGNLGTTVGATWAEGDFNGDGNVNVLGDGFILVGQLGQATTRQLIVDNSLDVVNGDTSSVPNLLNSPGVDGISLREAIIASNNTPVPDFINFDRSVFTGGADSLIRLTGGELGITDTLSIDGSTAFDVTISGDANGDDITDAAFITDVVASFGEIAGAANDLLDDNSRVLNFVGVTGDLTLTGLMVTGGRTMLDNESGAGIRFVSSGQLLLTDSSVRGNSTAGRSASGGAIYVESGFTTLSDSTVSDNSTAGRSASGGAIYTESGSLTLANSTVSNNSTAGRSALGGGIATDTGSVSLVDSTVDGNSTSGTVAQGGGIVSNSGDVTLNNSLVVRNSTTGVRSSYGGGIKTNSGAVTLVNSSVDLNFTEGFNGQGGGIQTRSGTVTLNNSSVDGNSTAGRSASGGGIHSIFGSVVLVDSTVNNNSTMGDSADGGAIYARSGSVSVTNSSISDNTTAGIYSDGGGISTALAPVSLTGSTISGNSTRGNDASGGGIYTRGSATLIGSTISGNSTEGVGSLGGGILTKGDAITLGSSTVTENSAGDGGGGIFADTGFVTEQSLTIQNSIVAGNTQNTHSGTGSPNDLVTRFSDSVALDHSLIGVMDDASANSTFSFFGSGNQLGTFTSPLDPLLAPLADNGGPTLTHTLLPGSPAIDAGNSTEAFDQRGFDRVVDQAFVDNASSSNGSDIGAVEFEGTILIVTTANDELDASDTDLSTFDPSDLSLREAIAITNGLSGSDGVFFDPSVFTGGADSLIRLIDGELEITDGVAIDASTSIDVTITGDANSDDVTDAQFITDVAASFGGTAEASDDLLDDNSRVLNFSGEEGNLTLARLTVTGGRTTATSDEGGGIRFDSAGDFSVINSTVAGNSTTGSSADGGGIYTDNGPLTLLNSTVSRNSTLGSGAYGGGINSRLALVTLNNSTVIGNSTVGRSADGGGIHVFIGDVTLNDSTVSGNFTLGDDAGGGGIYVDNGDLTLVNSTVSGNSTSGDDAIGGGLALDSGELTIVGSTVSGNSTSGEDAIGGGVYVDFGELTLVGSTISGNFTLGDGADGGGIYSNFGAVRVTNSTVTENTSAGEGGGVFFDSGFSPTPLTIENSIIADNLQNQTSEVGGTPNDLALENADDLLTINHSLIGTIDNVTLPIIGNTGNLFGTELNPLDPLLSPLTDNGGPTQTHALLFDSPAFDAGSNALAVDENGVPLTTDQRGPGFDRILGDSVDIGAFEFDPSSVSDAPVVLNTVRDEGGVLRRPDLLSTFSVSLDADVNIETNDLTVFNESLGGVAVDLTAVMFDYDSSTQTATWDFGSLPLDAAFYSFELSDSVVSVNGNVPLDGDGDGVLGGNFVESIYVAIPGDITLNGQVNVLEDGFPLVGNLGTTGGATWALGDFNSDGNVNVLGDAFILVSNLGRSVFPTAAQTLTLAGDQAIDSAFEDDDLLGDELFV